MSADLELRLPIIKLLSISRDSDKIDRDADSESSCISEEECHTPKSPEHMIPPILCCPPAPRKPRRRTSCKRKLCELDFFEVVAKEEIDSFFRTAEENIGGGGAAKRRCVV